MHPEDTERGRWCSQGLSQLVSRERMSVDLKAGSLNIVIWKQGI